VNGNNNNGITDAKATGDNQNTNLGSMGIDRDRNDRITNQNALTISANNLVGDWDTEWGSIYLDANGSTSWSWQNGTTSIGTWKV